MSSWLCPPNPTTSPPPSPPPPPAIGRLFPPCLVPYCWASCGAVRTPRRFLQASIKSAGEAEKENDSRRHFGAKVSSGIFHFQSQTVCCKVGQSWGLSEIRVLSFKVIGWTRKVILCWTALVLYHCYPPNPINTSISYSLIVEKEMCVCLKKILFN